MGEYDDIINLPHYEPKHHQRMSMLGRAAQFAPFAAVAGHDAAIREEGRVTEEWIAPGDTGRSRLDSAMALLMARLPERPLVAIDYFLPDPHKAGGSYQHVKARVKRIDELERLIELADGRTIMIDHVSRLWLPELP